ncbi:MAG: xylose isomerase [Acidobacteriota bacterium]|jgi:xylose isomerase
MPTAPLIGAREYFPGIGTIPYEGPDSGNPLAFKHYDAERPVAGKTLREHLRFSVAYWHSLCGAGTDPFGAATRPMPWVSDDPLQTARDRLDAAFELITKLGAPYWCFHDRDLAPEGASAAESADNLGRLTEAAAAKQEASGVKLLWGTANLFSHPRYMNGAATSPDFAVLPHAAAQVKAALDATMALKGENYVFWGGREGYFSLLNTDMRRELDHLAVFLRKARDYGRAKGFRGNFLIEPKPMEPTKHQYDFDVAAVIAFLQRYDLVDDFKINIENNHATLARHTFAHEIQTAVDAGLFGSLDVNQGDPHSGWDTDEFLHNLYDAVEIMLVLLRAGGLRHGGLNFDAKLRRSSTDPEDIFIAHISSMDTLARGLIIAHEIIDDGELDELLAARYASFDSGRGAAFERGDMGLSELALLAEDLGEPELRSGKQELFESIVNRYLR